MMNIMQVVVVLGLVATKTGLYRVIIFSMIVFVVASYWLVNAVSVAVAVVVTRAATGAEAMAIETILVCFMVSSGSDLRANGRRAHRHMTVWVIPIITFC